MITKEQLKEMRVSAGMTQQDLANKVEMSRPNISDYERGAYPVGWNVAEKWADACGFKIVISILKKI